MSIWAMRVIAASSVVLLIGCVPPTFESVKQPGYSDTIHNLYVSVGSGTAPFQQAFSDSLVQSGGATKRDTKYADFFASALQKCQIKTKVVRGADISKLPFVKGDYIFIADALSSTRTSSAYAVTVTKYEFSLIEPETQKPVWRARTQFSLSTAPLDVDHRDKDVEELVNRLKSDGLIDIAQCAR